MIDELIARAAGATGLNADQARAGLAAALSLIKKHGDEGQTGELFNAVPGSEDLSTEGDAMTRRSRAGSSAG